MQRDPVRVTLPFPPSANNMFITPPGRRRVKSPRYMRWRNQAVMLIRVARLPTVTTPSLIVIRITPPNNRVRDLDNLIKPILDACVEGGLLASDDRKVVQQIDAQWSGTISKTGAEAVVEIRPAAAEVVAPPPAVKLGKLELRELEKLLNGAVKLLGPSQRISPTYLKLIAKGLVRTIPGLLDDTPQGLALV